MAEGEGRLGINWAALHRAMPHSKWLTFPLGGDQYLYVVGGAHCHVVIERCPSDCAPGRWLAHLVPLATDEFHFLSSAKSWPRHYMDLDRAKAEVEAWLRKREEWRDAPAG